jgi:hypothetical protein
MSNLPSSPLRRPVRTAPGASAYTTIEWRDVLLCSAAPVLVFPQFIFPDRGPDAGLPVSPATVVRPRSPAALLRALRKTVSSGRHAVTVPDSAAI